VQRDRFAGPPGGSAKDENSEVFVISALILAAGASSRFGRNKLLCSIGGETLLARAVRACAALPTGVVCSPLLEEHLDERVVRVVLNDQPDLGMGHSVQLANACVDSAHSIAVVPADLALIEPEHVARVIAASLGVDVTYPQDGDRTPGHPVIFSPRARAGIPALSAGDTIRRLRDRESLTRRILRIEESWPYLGVDRASDLELISGARPVADFGPHTSCGRRRKTLSNSVVIAARHWVRGKPRSPSGP
jgi:molybdenum cofactor cytidylyltransferase